ncbi:hypothetical protein BOX15_Mlig011114g3 [Macrostomum lignano]|uniref:Uncharacterized protein n=1 Tax=Macrostomum lignano TaxID=282301 RepID=A0A267DSF9_9PLAT|nr:hypothetical protein BOX15_Mlig011114g4 [Macrostomum lignano]PAA52096.1 hypothetical protein BOX15_Mlig011114g3 [Macrostomum lignano]
MSDKAASDNKSNQCNPNNERYAGHQPGYQGTGTKADLDNHATQLNPNNERYQAPGGQQEPQQQPPPK